jgi:hypothetical protein
MPYIIRKKGGKRPYKIIRVYRSGRTEIVGSSTNKKDAQASVRVRMASE